MFAFIVSRQRLALALLLGGFSSVSHGLTFEEALRLAQTQAPQIAARTSEVAAAESLRIPAAELPDPRLVLGLENVPLSGSDRFSLSSDPMTMRRIGLMQEVPNAAKRSARAAAAGARAEVARGELRVASLNVMRETALAWLARETAERQLARTDALIEENRLFDAAVRARLAGGKAMAAEAVMPRQEAAMIENLRDELRARREQAVAALRRWIGTAAEAPLTGAAPDWPIEYEVLAHALHRHPELEVFEPRTRMLDAEVAEARAERTPDWAIEFAYQNRADEFGDMAMLQVAFDLPLFTVSHQDPRIAARIAERAAVDAEREAIRREHAAMLESDFAEYQRLSRVLQRQREVLIPLAEEKASLALAAWRGGQGSLADLSTARRERIEAELKAVELDGERRQMAARLHYTYVDTAGDKP